MGTGGKHIIVIMCISYLACTIHLIPAVRALTGENEIGKRGSPKSVLIGPIGDQIDIEVHRLCWNGIIAASRNRFAFFNAAVPIDGRSEEHTSELQSLMRISYAVFCLKKKKYNP